MDGGFCRGGVETGDMKGRLGPSDSRRQARSGAQQVSTEIHKQSYRKRDGWKPQVSRKGGNRPSSRWSAAGFHGQGLIFELVLLFSIAIAIFFVLLSVFSIYQGHFTVVSIDDQLRGIRNLVATSILKMAGQEGDGALSFDIPARIGDELYKIELTDSGLNVSTLSRHLSVFSALYNLNETYALSGRVVSSAGRILINKNGNTITII
jgi:hypothetical protein